MTNQLIHIYSISWQKPKKKKWFLNQRVNGCYDTKKKKKELADEIYTNSLKLELHESHSELKF